MSVADLAAALIRATTEREAADLLEPRLRDVGLDVERLAREPARPNLLARLPGRGAAPPLLLHGHLDVVGVDGQQWSRDPFGGEIVDGMPWGRGALDMKGGVAMLVDAVTALAAETPPPGDVILALLADEETGGAHGARFLVEEYPDRFASVRHAIGEFGGISIDLAGHRLYPIQVAEKQRAIVRPHARGAAGHGALPGDAPAVGALAVALDRITRATLPVHVTPVARTSIEAIAAAIDGPPAGCSPNSPGRAARAPSYGNWAATLRRSRPCSATPPPPPSCAPATSPTSSPPPPPPCSTAVSCPASVPTSSCAT